MNAVIVALLGPGVALIGILVNARLTQTRWTKIKTRLEVAKAFREMGREARAEAMTTRAEEEANELDQEPSWLMRVWQRASFPMVVAYQVGIVLATLQNAARHGLWRESLGLLCVAISSFLSIHIWYWARTTGRDRDWIEEAAAQATTRAAEARELLAIAESELMHVRGDAEVTRHLTAQRDELRRVLSGLDREARELRARAADVVAFMVLVGLTRRLRRALTSF